MRPCATFPDPLKASRSPPLSYRHWGAERRLTAALVSPRPPPLPVLRSPDLTR